MRGRETRFGFRFAGGMPESLKNIQIRLSALHDRACGIDLTESIFSENGMLYCNRNSPNAEPVLSENHDCDCLMYSKAGIDAKAKVRETYQGEEIMLLLAVLSVVFMLGLGFTAILYALADIEGRGNAPRLNVQPAMPRAIGIGPA